MKLTANERLGSLLIIVILAIAALCITLKQRGDAVVQPAQNDTVIIERPADTIPAVIHKPHKRKASPPAAERSPLDETF